MKRVLVVEDGKIIRKGISAMVSRCGVPVEEILECKNGLEALEIIQNSHVDVIITDIRMPKMDGISLVKELQKYLYIPKIIVISGYDDFSFALDLLRCGAREYLLKPIEREELKAIMEKLENEIQLENVEKESKKSFSYGQIRIMLSSDAQVGNEVDEIAACIGMKNELYQIICTNEPVTDKCKMEKIFFFSNIEGNNVILITAEKIESMIRNLEFNQYIGISECYQDFCDLRKAYLEAARRRVIAFCMQNKEVVNSYPISLSELESFVQRVGTPGHKENDQYLNEIVSKVKKSEMEGARFQEIIHQIVCRVKEFYGKILLDEGIYIDHLYYMLSFENIERYCTEIQRIFLAINQKALSENDSYRNRMKVEQAITYIKENYETNINMTMVSNYVSMNYTVFSITFKEYTGENFVNYLRNIRMEDAKRLLTQTDQKIGKIGLTVGYDNEKHFMKTFKTVVGITPSEFRKNTHIGK
ncbi:MAG: response regulator [Lachnotalea sp.]